MENVTKNKTVSQIAREIKANWKNIYFGAKPYLSAMLTESYGFDGEKSVVLYFLSNASTYKTNTAINPELVKEHKTQLKKLIGVK